MDVPRQKVDETDVIAVTGILQDVMATSEEQQIPGYFVAFAPYNRSGPIFANIHLIAARLKQALDPNNVANPTRFINIERMEQAEK